jgi:putative transcription factor
MVDCESCGAPNAKRRARIEGAVLHVCDKCVKLGDEIDIKQIHSMAERVLPAIPIQFGYVLRSDFSTAVKEAREAKQLTQEQLAEKIGEKAKIIERVEGGWEPPLITAKRLENTLGIKLIETIPGGAIRAGAPQKPLTLGDVIEVKDK